MDPSGMKWTLALRTAPQPLSRMMPPSILDSSARRAGVKAAPFSVNPPELAPRSSSLLPSTTRPPLPCWMMRSSPRRMLGPGASRSSVSLIDGPPTIPRLSLRPRHGRPDPGLFQHLGQPQRSPPGGRDPPVQPHAGHLLDPPGLEGYGSHLSREADLAPCGEPAQGHVAGRGGNGQGERKVTPGIVDPPAAHHVDVHLQVAEPNPGVFVQYGENLVHPGRVQTPDRAARLAQLRGGNQGLHLDQDRAPALHRGENHRARNPRLPAIEEHLRGVVHLDQTVGLHVEHARDMGSPKPVLLAAKDPETTIRVALQIEHDVDHVLED